MKSILSIAFLLSLLTGCGEKKDKVVYVAGVSLGGVGIGVGSVFVVCSPPSKNPFEPQRWDSVIVTDIRQGYVQYESIIRDTSLHIKFNRSMNDFIEAISRCNTPQQ